MQWGCKIEISSRKGVNRVIGIMSDSHDNLDAIQKAVRLFSNMNCELVIHAGDFIAPFAAKELSALDCPVKAVFGNCDGEKRGLEKIFEPIGMIKKEPFVFEHAQRKFLLTHTHFANEAYLRSGKYEVIVYGHTHKPEMRQAKDSLLINPGETGGWLTGKSSVALFIPEDLGAEIVYL
jgi:putative phosphoesterase